LEAATGTDALQLTKERRPDLVLLDINLPDTNGFEVCRQIREDATTERIPVVFLSAARLADIDVVHGLELGGDNYLREPVDPSVLVATVKALLRAREAEDELAKSNEQLRKFAFVVAHELQEPLRMVKSYTQMFERRYKDKLDEGANDFIHFTVEGVERMENFIRDMLLYSQSASGALDLLECSSRAAVETALAELTEAVAESGTVVQCGDLPQVTGDCLRLSQVFRNLIGNAIKYRSEAPPRIKISATQQRDRWVFAVEDNGVGIEKQYTDAVFALFKRLHGREKAGSGVGLAVCKEIVERHGGIIWVESTPGKGSTFYFTLPRAEE
jgi:light-regulated signal transduction histidine kinase (bacteriophytochrome)